MQHLNATELKHIHGGNVIAGAVIGAYRGAGYGYWISDMLYANEPSHMYAIKVTGGTVYGAGLGAYHGAEIIVGAAIFDAIF